MENLSNAIQTGAVRYSRTGSVLIMDKQINLNTNRYNKRERVFIFKNGV